MIFLKQLNYDIFFWDHVGQGNSGRIVSSIKSKLVHIDSFDAYTDTFNYFLETINPQYSKIDIISHSLGSHITALQLIKNQNLIDKWVAISPMFKVKMRKLPPKLALLLLKNLFKLTKKAPFQGNDVNYKLLTSSKENFDNYKLFLSKHLPQSVSAGVSVGWLVNALESNLNLLQNKNFQNIKNKTYFFLAEKDQVVDNKQSLKFLNQLPNGKLHTCKKAQHQILIESDAIQKDLFSRIISFLK